MKIYRDEIYIAVPPGADIKEQLQYRHMTQKEFAVRMDMSEKHISKLINGEVQLTHDVALRLETVLGVPAHYWNGLEALYREKIERILARAAKKTDLALVRKFPYAEIVDFGWVPPAETTEDKAGHLHRYFEMVSLSLLADKQLSHIACHRLNPSRKDDLAILAWAQQARILARDIETKTFKSNKLEAKLPEIRKLSTDASSATVTKIRNLLAGCGVALVMLPRREQSSLRGITFSAEGKVIIGLCEEPSARESFRFSLFHEIAHILLGHLELPNGTTANEEKESDNWANKMLCPSVN